MEARWTRDGGVGLLAGWIGPSSCGILEVLGAASSCGAALIERAFLPSCRHRHFEVTRRRLHGVVCFRRQVEMLNVLQDIDEAQTMLSSNKAGKGGSRNAAAAPPAVPHPTDVNYGLLNAEINLVDPTSEEYEIVRYVVLDSGVVSQMEASSTVVIAGDRGMQHLLLTLDHLDSEAWDR